MIIVTFANNIVKRINIVKFYYSKLTHQKNMNFFFETL